MPYIVDGNNLMGQTPGWHRDKSRARRNLIQDLATFARVKKARVTVVFDGAPDTEFPEGSAYQGVKVLYAERGSNADSKILKLVENATHPRGLSVVTSDRQLGFLAHSSGAKIIRSGEFRKLLVQFLEEPNRGEKEPSDVDLDQWLRYFGSTPEDDDDLDRSRFTSNTSCGGTPMVSSSMTQFHGYKDVTVAGLLSLLAQDYPNREALIYPNRNLRLTFTELEWLARQIAKGLITIGVQPGDRVALWANNIPEWVILQFALAKIGAILVTVNTSLRATEIEYLLKQSESSMLITISGVRDVNYVETILEILPELRTAEEGAIHSEKLPFLRSVIYIGDEHPDGMIKYDSLLQRAEETTDDELDNLISQQTLESVINMQYTSGTTGFPKGVMLTNRNIVNNGFWLAEGLGLSPEDKLCVPVPFFHCFGCVIGVLGAYTHAAALVPLEAFDPLHVLRYIEGERCTTLYGVPTMFIAELEQLDYHSFDLSTLRTGIMAGALCPEPLMRKVMERMNLNELAIAYGLTEASPGITLTPRLDSIALRTQTVGIALPEVEVKIIDPATREECKPGQSGELCCRGYNVMKGYYNNPKATDEAIDEERWLHTGDQASVDEAGYVRITGRIKELIIRGGENIAPKEIEDLLRANSKIADVYVFGVPDERLGEDVAAAIKLAQGATATVEEIREYCLGRIAKFKIPRYINFVDSFPMTASGKVQKFKLREMHLASRKNQPMH